MQCASSTASSRSPAACTASRNRGLRNRSGTTYTRRNWPAAMLLQPLVLLGHRERAIDERDRQCQRLQLIDLVLHQRDQRRDDQRQAVQHQGRQLVAEAFAAAGGHDAQAVASGQHGGDDLLLPGAEGAQPELRQVGFQVWCVEVGHGAIIAQQGVGKKRSSAPIRGGLDNTPVGGENTRVQRQPKGGEGELDGTERRYDSRSCDEVARRGTRHAGLSTTGKCALRRGNALGGRSPLLEELDRRFADRNGEIPWSELRAEQ